MVNRAIYADAAAEAVEGEGDGEVALSVDTIQQSLDVRRPSPLPHRLSRLLTG